MGGIIVFSIGVWTLNDRSFMERLLGTNLYIASAAILIVTGSIVAIISFLGTFGAYKEVKCMLLTYFIILVILFIVMATAGILGYVFRLEVDDRMQREMHSTIKLYGNDSQVTQAWDAVQLHVSLGNRIFTNLMIALLVLSKHSTNEAVNNPVILVRVSCYRCNFE